MSVSHRTLVILTQFVQIPKALSHAIVKMGLLEMGHFAQVINYRFLNALPKYMILILEPQLFYVLPLSTCLLYSKTYLSDSAFHCSFNRILILFFITLHSW